MRIVVFILSILVAIQGLSQKKNEKKLDLQILCGFAAQTSKEIQTFKVIVEQSDTAILKNKLFYGSKLEQILTAITLKHFQTNNSIKLSDHEENRIEEISKLKDRFSLCFTCTFHQDGTVSELFNRKEFSTSYDIIESFLSNKL